MIEMSYEMQFLECFRFPTAGLFLTEYPTLFESEEMYTQFAFLRNKKLRNNPT